MKCIRLDEHFTTVLLYCCNSRSLSYIYTGFEQMSQNCRFTGPRLDVLIYIKVPITLVIITNWWDNPVSTKGVNKIKSGAENKSVPKLRK